MKLKTICWSNCFAFLFRVLNKRMATVFTGCLVVRSFSFHSTCAEALLVFFLFGWSVMLTSCQQRSAYDSYGAVFSYDKVSQLDQSLYGPNSGDSAEVTVVGEIDQVCQVKGCWMTLKTKDGQPVRVTFKDYGFFVPTDASGKKVIIHGVAAMRSLDEETARHYAEDANETYEGGTDRDEVSIVASGVLIERGKGS